MSHEYSRSSYITALALQEQARHEQSHPSSSHHRHGSSSRHTSPMALPIPDLRFEYTYLKRVRPYVHVQRKTEDKNTDKEGEEVAEDTEGEEVVTVEWGKVIWITTRDQVISPLLQGALWYVLFVELFHIYSFPCSPLLRPLRCSTPSSALSMSFASHIMYCPASVRGTASIFLQPMAGALGSQLRQWWPFESPKSRGKEGRGIGYLRTLFGGIGSNVPGIAK